MDDSNKSLSAVLGYLVGRPLKLREILEALQMSRSRYYLQLEEGRLITCDNLVRAANNLQINEIDLLVRFGLIDEQAVFDYTDQQRGEAASPEPDAPAATPRRGRRKLSELAVRNGVSGL
ncbi:immunity repressor [Mycobacterium phage Hammy]|uniref:Immunity repressor n=1 Tax=Mycobacterium phage DarthP TaxID=2015879 RepID=A0A286MRB6_9CAUD|nr:transcriptional repressor [Mycobacterium phage DarthP]APD18210.1 immunity repressor [Mycobacterium phage Hammy]ASW31791.1 immunity repressor [Mycobacterium phage DarthP]